MGRTKSEALVEAEAALADDGFLQHVRRFSTDAACREYLEMKLWPNGPFCPKCKETTKVYKLKSKSARPGLYKCAKCRKSFTVTIGTIFEDSHIPLPDWFATIYLMMCSKKGMSTLQIMRIIKNITYKSALFMTHRVRHMFRSRDKKKTFRGMVEIDETYVGGKPRKMKGAPPAPRGRGTNKTGVVGIVQRGGKVVAQKIDDITKKEIFAFLESHVYNRSKVFSDDATYYTGLKRKYDHRKVVHKTWEWARREGKINVHTNTIESVWAIVKRGLYGTFHHVSKHRLNKYLDEFCFRYTWRKVSDAVRFQQALDNTDGRLKWYFKNSSTA